MNRLAAIVLGILLVMGERSAQAQCQATVPVFIVDLTGHPDSVWTSPTIVRNGDCCVDANCVRFLLTLDSMAAGIQFDIPTGAIPGGALYYQIGCGPVHSVGQPVCISGVGPHSITFCKPGNNPNTYAIKSLPKPSITGSEIVSQACIGELAVVGLIDTSIRWSSVPPNPAFDAFINCPAGCSTVTITPTGVFPPYVDYAVRGIILGGCAFNTFYDTARIYFVTNFAVDILPANPTVCFGSGTTPITATPSGGLPPYTYLWSTGATTQTINAVPGTYTVAMNDSLNCKTVYDTVVVTAFTLPIQANAGNDTAVCTRANRVYLNGTIQAASGGKWLGSGTFVPSDTSLNPVYYPSGAETVAGFAALTLVTRGNGTCPPDSDFVNVQINPTPVPVISGNDSICAYITSVYSTTSIAGHSWTWACSGGSIVGSNTGNSIIISWGAAGPGSVTVTQTNAAGCDSTVNKAVVIKPRPLPVITGPDSVCEYKTNSFSVTGVAGNTYSWTATGGTILGSNTTNSINVIWGTSGSGSVSVRQTNASACDSLVTKTFSIMPTPVPVIAGPDSVCEYKTNSFSVTAVAGNTYLWTTTGGTISGSNTGNAINVIWGSTGAGSVSVTQTNPSACDSLVTKTFSIRPTPVPVIAGPDSVCEYKTNTFSVTAVLGNTYSWTATGGTILGTNTTNSINVIWGANGGGSVSVRQTNPSGCDSLVTKSFSIRATPAPVITGPDSVCEYKTNSFVVTAVAGNTYLWSATGGTISGSNTGNSVNVIWGTAGTGSVSVRQTNPSACDSLVTKSFSIRPTPVPVIAGPDSVCEYKTNSFGIAAVAGNTYSWTANGGTIIGSNTGNSINVIWGATGAGSVSVRQTNPSACDSLVTKSFSIRPTPVPVITGPDSVCEYKTNTFSVTAVAGNTYSWTATGGTILGSNTSNSINVIWGATGAGSVSVRQTNPSACDSLVTKTFSIRPTPVPVITGPDSVCEYKTNSFSIAAVAGNTYAWTATGGTISGSNTSNSINVIWGATGAGSVSVTQTNSSACDSLVTKTFSIRPTPVPVIAGPDSVCEYKTNTFSVTAALGNTYSWTATGGTILGTNTTNSISVIWGANGTGSVSVRQTNPSACDSLVTKTFSIRSTPVPVITGPDSVCEYKTNTFSVTAVAGNTYSWTATGGTILGSNTNNSINIIWGATGAGSVSVTQTNPSACDSMVTKSFSIRPTPVPVITGPDSVCEYKTNTFSVIAVAGNTYSWTATGGSILGSNTSNSINVIWGATGAGSVSVRQTNPSACDSMVTKSFSIRPTPVPVITGPDSVCEYKTNTFSVTAVAGNTYSWTATGGTILGSNINNSINIIWGANGVGSVSVRQTNPSACDSMVTKSFSIRPTPVPVIAGPDSVCEYKTNTFSIVAVAGNTYSWTATGGTILGSNTSNSINVIWGATGVGSVSVRQTNPSACDSLVTKTFSIRPTPVPVITGPDSVCEYKTNTFSITAVAGNTYSWTATGGTILGSNTSNSINVIWGANGAGSVSVRQTNPSACDSLVTKSFSIRPTPVPVITGPDSVCEYKTNSFSVIAVAGNTYSWTATGGTILGSNTSNSINVIWGATGAGSVSVKQTNPSACDSLVTKSFSIRPTPVPVITGPDSVCEYKTNTFSVTAVAGNTYSWTATGGTILGSNTVNSINVIWGATGAGSVSVRQTNPSACDSLVTKSFSIRPTPVPVITGPDSVCEYKTNSFSVTAVAGNTYSWTATGGTILGSNTSNSINVIWGATGAGSVSVRQTNLSACDSPVTKSFSIRPTPVPVIAGPDSVCEYKTNSFGVVSVAGHTYSWSVIGGTILGPNTGNSISVRWNYAGQAFVTVMQTNSNGCDSVVVKPVRIKPTPVPFIGGPATVCEGKTNVFNVPASGINNFFWSVTGGTILGTNTASSVAIKWGTSGSGSLTVRQTNQLGCDSVVTLNVNINQTPVPAIAGPDTVCSFKIVNFNANPIAGSSYAWSVNGGTILGTISSSTVMIKWGSTGTGTVTLRHTNASGCDSIQSKTCFISNTPSPVIIGPDSVCEHKSNFFSVVAVAGRSYTWSALGGTIIGPNSNNTVTIMWGPTEIAGVTLVERNEAGCDSSVSIPITIKPTPAPVISGPDSVCQHKINTISVPSVPGNNYYWFANGGSIVGSNRQSSVRVKWTGTVIGSVTILQINQSGCDSIVTKNIKINTTPAPVISGPAVPCASKLQNYSITSASGHSYFWQVTGGSIIGANTLSSIDVKWGAPGPGSVSVRETNTSGCDSTITLTFSIRPTPAPVLTGPVNVCENKLTTYTVPNVPGNSYVWSVAGGSIAGPSNLYTISVKWGGNGAGFISLLQTNGAGCDSFISRIIQIRPTPVPVLTGNDSACARTVENYSVHAIAGNTYTWSVTGGTIQGPATGNSITVTWGNSSAGWIMLTETNPNGCDSSLRVKVLIDSLQEAAVNLPEFEKCAPLNALYTGINAASGVSYSWDLGDGTSSNIPNPDHVYNVPGTYTVRLILSTKSGCADTATATLRVFPPARANFSLHHPNTELYSDEDTLSTRNLSTNTVFQEWSWGDNTGDTLFEPLHLYTDPGNYRVLLKVVSPDGCEDTLSKPITVKVHENLFVPTAFTPNGDGLNDFFSARFENITLVRVLIFNRWGQIIFESTDPDFKWDGSYGGKPVQMEAYSFLISATTFYNKPLELKGTVTVLR
jgi:gliding motility-associated-like protein